LSEDKNKLIDSMPDYHLAVANHAAKLSEKEGVTRVSTAHVDSAKKEVLLLCSDNFKETLKGK
jgi:hypothetical protein